MFGKEIISYLHNALRGYKHKVQYHGTTVKFFFNIFFNNSMKVNYYKT